MLFPIPRFAFGGLIIDTPRIELISLTRSKRMAKEDEEEDEVTARIVSKMSQFPR